MSQNRPLKKKHTMKTTQTSDLVMKKNGLLLRECLSNNQNIKKTKCWNLWKRCLKQMISHMQQTSQNDSKNMSEDKDDKWNRRGIEDFLCTWDTFGQYEWDSAIARTPYWDKTMAKWGKQSCTLSFWVILPKQEYCGKYLMKRLFGPFWETHRICIKVSRVKWKTQNLAGCSFQNSGIIKTLEKPGVSRKWLNKQFQKNLKVMLSLCPDENLCLGNVCFGAEPCKSRMRQTETTSYPICMNITYMIWNGEHCDWLTNRILK